MKTVSKTMIAAAVIAAVAAPSVQAAYAENAVKEQAAANFVQADANNDGALNFDEFTTMVNLNAKYNIGRSRMIQRFGKYGVAFGRLDANADGLVTAEEISAIAARAKR